MENKNPLSPHIQIYSWHISSLVSIGHRITGVINIVILTLIFFWLGSLLLGEKNYEIIFNFFNSFFGKFFVIATIWSFTFHSLSELRHLFWDMGYGFELKTANLTGSLDIIFSLILIPLMIWFTFILAGIYDKTFAEVVDIFTSQPTKILISLLFVVSYFFSALTISEIFEDYMGNQKIKNVANKILYLFAILIPLLTLIIIYNLNL